MGAIQIRPERPGDDPTIRAVTRAAFEDAPHSSGTEAAIVEALREAGALAVSLVAVADEIVGHVAFSPVTVNGTPCCWFSLGPLAVRPDRQRLGIGRRLVCEGLEQLRERGAAGCVVLGDPAYYGRFGFASDPGLRFGDVPPRYFQRLVFSGVTPRGEVAYHPAFAAS
jgi:putative acetyltransferase